MNITRSGNLILNESRGSSVVRKPLRCSSQMAIAPYGRPGSVADRYKCLLHVHLTFNVRGHWDECAVCPLYLMVTRLGGMAPNRSPRHPLFCHRWFADDVIITCVQWYLRFKLSYRDLAELASELGVRVAPSTILRWVVCYALEFEKCWQAHESFRGTSKIL